MAVSHKTKEEVELKLVGAARLCSKHGYRDWALKISRELVPRVREFEGPDCVDMMAVLDKLRARSIGPETFETMLCNQLSTYIEVMKLHNLPEDIPPFKCLNGIVLEHVSSVGTLLTQMWNDHVGDSYGDSCLAAGIPLEYLHTIIRAYNNKVLLLGFLQKTHTVEFEKLYDKRNELRKEYNLYPPEEIKRVCRHYGRTCLGEYYTPIEKN
jgi:hypothetical protein